MSVCRSDGLRVLVLPLALSFWIFKTSIQYSAIYSNDWLLLPWRRYILNARLMVVIHRLIAFRPLWSLDASRDSSCHLSLRLLLAWLSWKNNRCHGPAIFSLDHSTLLRELKKALLRRLPFSLARIRRVFRQVTSAPCVTTSAKQELICLQVPPLEGFSSRCGNYCGHLSLVNLVFQAARLQHTQVYTFDHIWPILTRGSNND